MAFVALTSLIQTIQLQFLQPTSRVRLFLHDRPPLILFLADLSSMQAFLQNKSSGDDGGELKLRDLEIEIRDFALKAEDHIELQLSNILLSEYPEKATSHEILHQTLREAAKNAAELLKIITSEMGGVALTVLITKIKHHFFQPFPTVYLGDEAALAMTFFLEKLSSLQAFLLQGKSKIKNFETKIRIFALKAEDDIQIQLTNFLRAKDTQHEEEASQELHQTLGKAAEIAAELLKIFNKEKEHEREREMAYNALTSLIKTIELHFLQPTSRVRVSLHDRPPIISFLANLSSLQAFLLNKSSGALRDLDIDIRDFALRAEDDIEIQLSNFFLKAELEDVLLHQTLPGAAKNATELLKIITTEKESYVRETAMAIVALTTLITKFKYYFLQPFPMVSLGDGVGIVSFLEKLSPLQVCLLHGKSNGGTEIKIRNFALKAEDNIDIQLSNFLRAKDTEHEEEASQELRQTLREAAENAAELLKIINSRSNEFDEANETQLSNTWLKHAAASKSENVESDGSSHGFLKPEGRMVGRHHDCTVIKDQLFSFRFGPLKIISIVGMVGIGKTTLARNVYRDPSIALHFDVRGWVTIHQDYNKTRMLRDLLQPITSEEPNVIKKGSTPNELEMQVRKCLCGRRYLIVLDNIMSCQALTDIRECVPDEKVGSCILLTTSHPNPYFNYYIHNMTLLDPKESWELFCNTLSFEEHLAPKFEKIRNHVVEKCDGLPQLIVEVAKRLSKCNNIQQGWKKIEKELESLGILDRNAINVSYNMLPNHLKVCFLYFGVFPKRKKIKTKMLIKLWIAEGFLKPLEHKELEDQAYVYLQELTDRSLLLIEDRSCNGKIKTCRMHSALHSFCVGEAQKEGILCAVNTQKHSGLSVKAFANSCRWLSFYSHSFDYYVLFGTNIPRSIFFFHENFEMFVPHKLLRVLAFDTSISFQGVPVQLGDLAFLRYLSITQWFKDMDDVVSKNPNLETLVVSSNGAPIVHLPSSIWKPPHLRHLELGNSYMVNPPSADKKNLQTLSWVVRPLHCRKKMYNKFPNIKNLKIFLKDDIEPSHIGGCCSNPIILDHFDYLEGLEKLSISVSIGCNAALPEQCMYPLGLKKLKLSGTNICERDLNVIAMLPQLMVLKLENAFHGTVWNAVAERGFPQLIFLLLEAKELKQWVVSRNHFPMLSHLVLRSCNCLEEIPKGFAEIYSLETIELEECHSSLVASANDLETIQKLVIDGAETWAQELPSKRHCSIFYL